MNIVSKPKVGDRDCAYDFTCQLVKKMPHEGSVRGFAALESITLQFCITMIENALVSINSAFLLFYQSTVN